MNNTRFAAHLLLAIALSTLAPQDPDPRLAGTWQRDDSRGDRNYWMGEYPEMTLEITLEGDSVRVRQALGSVRDGVSLPGSGERFLDFELITDGRRREVATPNASRREAAAEWAAGTLRVDATVLLGGADGDEPMVVEMSEHWRILDGGETLEIRRVVSMTGRRAREAKVVFARVR